MEISDLIPHFIENIRNNNIDIYNEASIQYELAIFLRQEFKNKNASYKIQLERNISYFSLDGDDFEKKEMDIVLFNERKNERLAIEIKYPTNGQYPEQMYSFIKDIKFLEQLKEKGFENNIFIAFANDSNFWNPRGDNGTIYDVFRVKKELKGVIEKPTGRRDKNISLNDSYRINWIDIQGNLKYFFVKV